MDKVAIYIVSTGHLKCHISELVVTVYSCISGIFMLFGTFVKDTNLGHALVSHISVPKSIERFKQSLRMPITQFAIGQFFSRRPVDYNQYQFYNLIKLESAYL